MNYINVLKALLNVRFELHSHIATKVLLRCKIKHTNTNHASWHFGLWENLLGSWFWICFNLNAKPEWLYWKFKINTTCHIMCLKVVGLQMLWGCFFCFGFWLFVAFKSKRVKKTSVCYAETFKETYRYEEYNSSTDISLLTETPYSR